jgi:hypothetical protein
MHRPALALGLPCVSAPLDDLTARPGVSSLLNDRPSRLERQLAASAMPVLFGLSLLASAALYVAKPLPDGHAYQIGLRVTAILTAIWYASRYKASWLQQPRVLALIFCASFYFVIERPLTVKPSSEIIAAYTSAFAALDAGANPYTCGCIVHFDSQGQTRLGNFNYPPLELLPYYGVAKLLGRWDHRVLTGTLLLLHLLSCSLLFATFRRTRFRTIAAFVPLIACFELYTNVALTLLSVALIVWVICSGRVRSGAARELGLGVLFGVGLLTKFLIIPLFATYVWQRLALRPWRALASSALRLLGPVLVAALLMSPYGIANVFRETILFNLVLRERAQLTTFYPNVLSGMLEWMGFGEAFPFLAVLLLGGAILATRRLRLLNAMLINGSVFLLVSPTPEPQYLPVMMYIALASVLLRAELSEAPDVPALAGQAAPGQLMP